MTSPPESARVVVVGAGIAGAGVAHHLAERGWEQIVVVDQGPLFQTGGSTSHAPGLVFQHNASRTMTRLAQWTVEKLSALGAFHPVGSIEVATTDERWAELDRRWARARGYGLEARVLDPRRSPSSSRWSIPRRSSAASTWPTTASPRPCARPRRCVATRRSQPSAIARSRDC